MSKKCLLQDVQAFWSIDASIYHQVTPLNDFSNLQQSSRNALSYDAPGMQFPPEINMGELNNVKNNMACS